VGNSQHSSALLAALRQFVCKGRECRGKNGEKERGREQKVRAGKEGV